MNVHLVIRELCEAVEKQIGSRTIRYLLIVAVPNENADAQISSGGNGTPSLTRKMLTRAVLGHELGRKDVESGEGGSSS